MTKTIEVSRRFVNTVNARNFEVMMEGLTLSRGEGRLGLVFSPPGRGKSRTAQWYGAQHQGVYMQVPQIFKSSELDFLQTLLDVMGHKNPPYRKGPCWRLAVKTLKGSDRPVFIDELEKLPAFFLDLVKDFADIAAVPVVLIGEEELVSYMQRNRRVWSRTFRQLEFRPIDEGDIIMYFRENAGLNISPQIARIFLQASSGDFRIVWRDLLNLAQIANGKQTREITEEMARIAVKQALSGSK